MDQLVVGTLGFCVNFLLAAGTGRLTGATPTWGRCALCGLLGGGYTASCLFPGFLFLAQFHWRLVFRVLMGLVAFGYTGRAWRQILVFCALQLSLSGIAWGIGQGGWEVIPVCGATALLMMLVSPKRKRYASVVITHGGRQISLTALVDTGNTLRDPVSGDGVLVVDARAAWELLGLDMQALRTPLQTLTASRIPGLRLIPYHGVGKPRGMLLGMRMEQVLIDGEPARQIVAFAPHAIGGGNGYEALAGGRL